MALVRGTPQFLVETDANGGLGFESRDGRQVGLISTDSILYQSGIPFWLPPGDGGANGLIFTGTRGVFTLSAAAPMQYAVAFTRNCYCYLPAGAGGLVAGGWYWCQMSDDTNGEIFQEMYSGTGQPKFVSSPTAHPNLTATRITQTLSAVTIFSVIMPGGSLGPNGILRAEFGGRFNSSATSKALRIRINTQHFGYMSGTTSGMVGDFESVLQNQGTEQKHTRVSANIGRAHATGSAMVMSDITSTILDTSVDTTLSAIMTIGATTDSIIGYVRRITVEYGA